ncbi:MAG TPA: response regulator transcription factor [Herpetosiphonaceae bacterium]
MAPIRVLLVEDHALVRAGMRELLQKLDQIEVVAEAGDGREALQMIELHQPDVALMDIAMPGLNGLEAAARAQKQFPNTKIIMLSMHANEEYVWQALRAGAAGYLLKDSGTPELALAVSAVARGETYLSPAVSKHVTDYIRRVGGERGADAHPMDKLTSRQREILQLIAEGRSTQEIANRLSISIKTVETHRSQLMERLDIHDIAGLVRYAVRMGLVAPTD